MPGYLRDGLGERDGLIVHRHRTQQGAGVAGDLVAQHDALEGAQQPGFQVACVVEQRGAGEHAEDDGDAELQRPLLVEFQRRRGHGEAGEAVGLAAQLRGPVASTRSMSAAGKRTRRPSTLAPEGAHSSRVGSCFMSTPMSVRSSVVSPWMRRQAASSQTVSVAWCTGVPS